MKRRTQNARLAMERLAEHGNVSVEKVPGGYLMFRGGSKVGGSYASPINAKRSLARLVTTAQFNIASGGWGMTREQIREVVRLTYITSRGTSAHEEQSIREVLTR